MSKIVSVPKSQLIEKTALQFACEYYEAGRNTGLTSKHKNARAFAKANVEKFVPLVISTFLDMLANPKFSEHMKREIWDAIQERHNDPTLQTPTQLPNIDVKKLISIVDSNKGSDATQVNLKAVQTIENALKSVNKDYIKQLKVN